MSFFHPILFFQFYIFYVFAAISVPCYILSLIYQESTASAFILTGAVNFVLGSACYFLTKKSVLNISNKQIYLVTTISWCTAGLAGSLPFYTGIPGLSAIDAVFESVSGITTTGSTILTGLDFMPRGILLWRGILQWMGGIGIIVLGIAVLPYLRIGGMRLFQTESSDWSEKSFPKARQMIRSIGTVYIGLSALAAVSYWFAGMAPFDATVHAMTSLATGGYANYDASLGYYTDTPSILWLATLFMLMGALPFLQYIAMLHGDFRSFIEDKQIRGFLSFVFIVVTIFSIERFITEGIGLPEAVTHAAFNVASIITTTGYASQDYTTWSSFAVVVFFYLTFFGGCSGSTAGAIKFFRFQLAFMMLRNQLLYMRHPNIVLTRYYNGRKISDEIIRSMVAFTFYFGLTIAVIALCLSLTGLDFVTSVSGAATAVANVGPGLGDTIGPAGNFSSLTDTAKMVLCGGMIIGRLEILTVLILFSPMFWKT